MILHRTCAEGYAAIRADGAVRPHAYPGLPVPVSWWGEEWLDAETAGLPAERMEFSFVPLTWEPLMPWPDFALAFRLSARVRAEIEKPPRLAKFWWVATVPVKVLLDEVDVMEVLGET